MYRWDDPLEAMIAADEADDQPPEHRDQARRKVERDFNRRWNSPQVGSHATLPELVAARWDRIEMLLERIWDVVLKDFGSHRIVGRTGMVDTIVDLGPDHRIRLRAAALLIDIVTAGRPTSPPAEPNRQASIEDLRDRWSIRDAGEAFAQNRFDK
jgi:hypothetical protein